MAGYDPASYRNYLRYSHDRHLLVEGRDDKRFFELLLDEVSERTDPPIKRDKFRVDTAESLVDFSGVVSGIGNREKVQRICESVDGLSFAKRLVGFVDREFREFDLEPRLQDRVSGHKVSGRLVWSRGHSIENYLFDFQTVRTPLRSFSVTDRFREALDLLEIVFESVVRLACTASVAGDELQKLRLVRASVSRDILEVTKGSDERLFLAYDVWETSLVRRHKLTVAAAKQLVERVEFWNDIVGASEWDVVRWMCHGHIGLAFIWAAYSRCVLEVCQRAGLDHQEAEAEAQRVLRADSSVRFNACADAWAQRALGDHSDCPLEVFRLLGIAFE